MGLFDFNWGEQKEEKTSLDFSSMSKEELLNHFKEDTWGELSDKERLGMFQEIENRNAAMQGREAAVVVATPDQASYYGAYNGMTNVIEIDVTDNRFEALDTYIHESNHAYQNYCEKNGINADAHENGMIAVENKRDENGILYNYESHGIKYDMQCSELDSNNKAASAMLALESLFGTDEDYQSYMEGRNTYFTKVNENLLKEKDVRNVMQNEQLDRAFYRDDISVAQYAKLKSNINNEMFEDKTVEESFSIGKLVEQLHNKFEESKQEELENNSGTEESGTKATGTEESGTKATGTEENGMGGEDAGGGLGA